jgi:hypothetical protein
MSHVLAWDVVRHKVNNLSALKATQNPNTEEKSHLPGFLHIDIKFHFSLQKNTRPLTMKVEGGQSLIQTLSKT